MLVFVLLLANRPRTLPMPSTLSTRIACLLSSGGATTCFHQNAKENEQADSGLSEIFKPFA
jgi:hypothetical protein